MNLRRDEWRTGGFDTNDEGLTVLQQEVRRMLAEGKSQAAIAKELDCSRQHVHIVKKRLEELGAL